MLLEEFLTDLFVGLIVAVFYGFVIWWGIKRGKKR